MTMERFTLEHTLTPGTVLVEASAGTGKTYSIASLYLRMVYELDLKTPEILVVTFTNAATAELKTRIRSRLQQAVKLSQARLHNLDADPETNIPPIRSKRSLVEQDLQRLQSALESFDQASIFTIHGFCKRLLERFPLESHAETTIDYGIRPKQVLNDLVQDLYTEKTFGLSKNDYHELIHDYSYNFGDLKKIAKAIVENIDASIYPPGSDRIEALRHDLTGLRTRLGDLWPAQKTVLEEFYEAEYLQKSPQLLQHRSFTQKAFAQRIEWLDEYIGQGLPLVFDPKGDGVLEAIDSQSWTATFTAKGFRKNINTGAKAPADIEEQLEECIESIELLETFETYCDTAREIRSYWITEFARNFRSRYTEHLEKSSEHSFDDLLNAVATPLTMPGNRLCQAVQGTYKAALIDEFQDTDALQWSIFETIFHTGRHYLYLIGDPKQAIYRFRGANLNVYEAAKSQATRIMTMDTNFRSDKAYNDALNHLLGGKRLFLTNSMDYNEVGTPDHHHARRVHSSNPRYEVPVELQYFLDEEACDYSKDLEAVVSSDIVTFLKSDTTIVDGGETRPIRPADIAVLVNSNQQAADMKLALDQRGVPAVIGKAGNIFASDEALWLWFWLRAIQTPQSNERARTLAITPLLGATPKTLLAPDNPRNEELVTLLGHWRAHFIKGGFASAYRSFATSSWSPDPTQPSLDLTTRLLRYNGGERIITNLQHLRELLHEVDSQDRLGLDGCTRWLATQRREALDDDMGGDETTELRLETERNALEIVTVHKSKGLEYPFVYAPYLGRTTRADEGFGRVCPDLIDPTRRVINLTTDKADPIASKLKERANNEALQEHMRRFYVALTRPRLRLTLYWGPIKGHHSLPLSLMLFATIPEDLDTDAELKPRLSNAIKKMLKNLDLPTHLENFSNEDLGVVTRPAGPIHKQTISLPSAESAKILKRAEFKRQAVDSMWRTESYSGITERLGKSMYQSSTFALDDSELEHDFDQYVDPETAPTVPLHSEPLKRPEPVHVDDAPDVPFAAFEAGANAGTFLHKLYEEFDFEHAKDPILGQESLDSLIATWAPYHNLRVEDWTPELRHAWLATLKTPLGGPMGNRSLSDISKADRLDELQFHLPVAGGLAWRNRGITQPVATARFASAMRHRPDETPTVIPEHYFDTLEEGLEAHRMAGFLKGFIDLTFRAKDPATGETRWYIADYKSNRIDPHRTRRYPSAHFSQEMLLYEMQSHHYILQYHLYAVALHRFLESRLGEDYDYERHFGGVYYLFFRGMLGEASSIDPTQGVFFDRPSEQTIELLSSYFSAEPTHYSRGDVA